MKFISFLAVAALFAITTYMMGAYVDAALDCASVVAGAQCGHKNLLPSGGRSLFPTLNDISTDAYVSEFGHFGMRFNVPHCEGCMWVASFIPLSSLDTPKLALSAGDVGLTSLPASSIPAAGATLWGDLFATGKDFCDDVNRLNVGAYADTSLFTHEPSALCESSITLKSMGMDAMVALERNGAKVFTTSYSGNYFVLQTTLYLHAIYPYSMQKIADEFKTYRYPVKVTICYDLVANVVVSVDVIRQRDILLTVTPNKKMDVTTKLFLKPQYGWDGDCTILTPNPLNAAIDYENVVDDMKQIRFLSPPFGGVGRPLFQGIIKFSCPIIHCDIGGANCQSVDDAIFNVAVDIGAMAEITRTHSYEATGTIYTGTDANPFVTPFAGSIGSGVERVGVAISSSNLPTGFFMDFENVKICPKICSPESAHWTIHLVDNGLRLTETNMLGARVHAHSEMSTLGLSAPNTLGISLDLSSTVSMNIATWVFDMKVKFSVGGARTIFDERSESASQEETATIIKRIDLYASAMHGSSSSSVAADAADKLIAILIPSIAGGICLMCMFGIVALVGFILLGSILRKGVHAKGHHRMEDDHSIPSDSDVDMRNHAV